jgi:hypothetical protein
MSLAIRDLSVDVALVHARDGRLATIRSMHRKDRSASLRIEGIGQTEVPFTELRRNWRLATTHQEEPVMPAVKTPATPKTPAKAKATSKAPSFRSEAVAVLKATGEPMHVNELYSAILKRGKLKPGGLTPQATLNAVLIRSSEFERTAPGTWKLAA